MTNKEFEEYSQEDGARSLGEASQNENHQYTATDKLKKKKKHVRNKKEGSTKKDEAHFLNTNTTQRIT